MVNSSMEQSPHKDDMLDIKGIIQFGSKKPENYQVLFYNEIYNKKVNVMVRGLSSYEYDEISMEMYGEIKDTRTINYVFDSKKSKKLKDLSNDKTDKKEPDILDKETPDGVNVADLLKAFMLRNVLIVYHSMKDYISDLTINQVKQLDREAINEIADRINFKSGKSEEVQKKIEFFRERTRKRKTAVSNEKGLSDS